MTVLVSDSFNRANSTTTLGTTDSYNGGTGASWTSASGTWGITNNQAYSPTAGVSYVETGQSDVTASVTITWQSNAGIIIRATDSSNFIMARISSGNIGLFKMVSGSATPINSAYSFATTSGSSHTVKIVSSGSSLTVYLDGSSVIIGNDSFNQTATKCGLRTSGDTTSTFDNFEVDGASTGGTTALSSTVKSISLSTSNLVGGTHNMGTNMVKSNSSTTSAVLVDRIAESTTVSSSSSGHDGMTVSRAMGSTVKSNSTQTATLTVASGTLVPITSNVKSNSSSSLVSQVSRLLVYTGKTQSSATSGLRNLVQAGSITKSNSLATVNMSVQTPITRLHSLVRSNSFAKVMPYSVKRNVSTLNNSKTKATAYLLTLQVVSQMIETIKFKRGNKANLPSLNVGEPAFTLDTDEVFVGSSLGNIKLLGLLVESSVANLPSPSVNNQWMIAGVKGSTGVADALYICKMLSNGTYDWVQFA